MPRPRWQTWSSTCRHVASGFEVPLERRHGGAGPSDSGMLWVGGFPITVPTDNATAAASPYALKPEDDGYAIFEGSQRLATASPQQRPRFYDLTTADGIPYWKIGLLHLDSFASTVVPDLLLLGQRRSMQVLRDRRLLGLGSDHRQEEPRAAGRGRRGSQGARRRRRCDADHRELQRVDRGARYVARCGHAVKEATGLPVESSVRAAEEARGHR